MSKPSPTVDPPQCLDPWRGALRLYDLSETNIGFVYFLCKGDQVVYVGQSSNIGARIAQHKTQKVKDFDNVWFLKLPSSEVDLVEKAFIASLRPRDNKRESKAEPTNKQWDTLRRVIGMEDE